MFSNVNYDYPVDSMNGGYYIITPDGKMNWFNNMNQYNYYINNYEKSSSGL